jgi:hypothetical protein
VADIRARKTYRYDIQPDGSLANKTLFCELGSDGMTIDAENNLYLTGRGVTVFNRDGQKIEHIAIDEPWTANVCFGGADRQTLFHHRQQRALQHPPARQRHGPLPNNARARDIHLVLEALVHIGVHPSQFPDRLQAELVESLRVRRINPKFHYESRQQARAWLRLHEVYSPARRDRDSRDTYLRALPTLLSGFTWVTSRSSPWAVAMPRRNACSSTNFPAPKPAFRSLPLTSARRSHSSPTPTPLSAYPSTVATPCSVTSPPPPIWPVTSTA